MAARPDSSPAGKEFDMLLDASPYSEHLREAIKATTSENLTVLDIGCGPELRDLRLLREMRVPNLVGVDIMSRIDPSVRKGQIDYVCCDVDSLGLPIPDESFDFIIMDNVIEHLYDPRRLLTECHRVLRKGGSIVVLTPNQARLINRVRLILGRSVYYPLDIWLGVRKEHITKKGRIVFAGHIREYTVEELKELLSLTGLQTESVRLYPAAMPSLREEKSKSRLVLSLYNLAERVLPGSGYMISIHAKKA